MTQAGPPDYTAICGGATPTAGATDTRVAPRCAEEEARCDGDYHRVEKTLTVYKAEWAAAAGQPVADRPQTIVAIVLIGVRGDVDGDLSDLGALLGACGTCSGAPPSDAAADLDHSGCVEFADLATLWAHYGE